jgi:hypothetical protein
MRTEPACRVPRCRRRIVLLGVAILLAIAAPGNRAVANRHADIRGRIASIEPVKSAPGRTDVLGVILVDGVKHDDTSYDKASIRIRSDTEMVGADGQSVQFADLAVGVSVEVGFTGPVAESYPVQASAAWLRVVTP